MLKDCLITRVANAAAAAQTAVDGTPVDMQADGGYDGVVFVALLGDVTATSVLTLTAYESASSDGSSPTAISGAATTAFTAGASDADNKALVADVRKTGSARYIFPRLTRTTANAVVDGVIAIQYRGHKAPVAQGSTVLASVQALS